MSSFPHFIHLNNGTRLLVRPVRTSDRPLLLNAIGSVSQRTLFFRFLTNKTALTRAELDYLVDVDQCNHVAIGAVTEDEVNPFGAAIARYIRDERDPSHAYLALAVHDVYQKQGLGRHLLATLATEAQNKGIDTFIARMHPQQYGLRKKVLQVKGGLCQLEDNMITAYLPTQSLQD